jgi:LysR family transcriptional regulator, hypochlorite-specific transcription factor HypT
METKWLEDLAVLAETRNFSQAAQLRHITQSAFSRRIQSLEAWACTELVDRSSQPPRLTPAGEFLRKQGNGVLEALATTRGALRCFNAGGHDTIDFAATPVLGFSFYPAWSAALAQDLGGVRTRLVAQNSDDCTMFQELGRRIDFLLAYDHPALARAPDMEVYEKIVLQQDRLAPFSKADAFGRPLFEISCDAAHPTPYLGYTAGACLGRLAEWMLEEARSPVYLDQVYETDMVIGLKAMVLQGHGVAFLPYGAIAHEVDEGKVACAAGLLRDELQLQLDVCMYRRKPSQDVPPKRAAQALWEGLGRGKGSAPALHGLPREQPGPEEFGGPRVAARADGLYAVGAD